MQAATLQLRHYHFTAFPLQSREWIPDTPPVDAGDIYPPLAAGDLQPRISHAEPDTDDPHEFVVNLKLEHEPGEESAFPYRFLIEAEGLFSMDHHGDPEERRRLVAINGASTLYGTMREHLLTLSARHRHGPVLLPCPDFRGLAKREAGKDTAGGQG